jgi:hypothetical protein
LSEAFAIVDSVTELGPDFFDRVAICASHCGTFVAEQALLIGLRGLVGSDAGIGRERAGVAGLALLDRYALPAAAVSHASARIGDGSDCAVRGRISVVNDAAAELGIKPGLEAREAARLMLSARPATCRDVSTQESHRVRRLAGGGRLVILDSAGLVGPEDRGAAVITGSHGGLLGGRPPTAIKADVLLAVYNDAGGGIDEAGYSRLPALDRRNIAAATVSAWSARIGDGLSTFEDGIVSRVNETARECGCDIGSRVMDFVAAVLGHPLEFDE